VAFYEQPRLDRVVSDGIAGKAGNLGISEDDFLKDLQKR
jgi:hypothetical protein